MLVSSIHGKKSEYAATNTKAGAQTGKASVWNQKQKRFIAGDMTIDEAEKKNLGSIVLNGAKVFFESDTTFKQWLATGRPADSLKSRQEYGSSTSPYIKACVANTSDSEPKRSVSTYFQDSTCIQRGGTVEYQIYKANGLIQIDLTKKFVYQGDKDKFQLVKQKIEAALPCVRSIYANQGIHLNFNYSLREAGDSEYQLEDIKVYEHYPRNDADHWGILGSQEELHTAARLCTMMAHELGHHLGLDDSYKDAECALRPPPSSPYDLMADSHRHPEVSRLNQGEIKRILSPFCEGKVDKQIFPDEPDYGTFFSVGLGVEKFGTTIPDFGYLVSAGYTRVSKANVSAELQLNYAQPGLALNTIQDKSYFGYSQAILHFGYFFGNQAFWRSYAGVGSKNPSFLALYFGLGFHLWNYKGDDQRVRADNNPFAATQAYPTSRTAWVFDAGLSYFIIRQVQVRLQYSFISTDKPYFQTIALMVQYNIFLNRD